MKATKKATNKYLEKLTKAANEYGVYKVCKGILEDPRFVVWSGSSKPYQHHYGKGGLVQHTSEVADLCRAVRLYYFMRDLEIDPKELFLSAFFHDVGKMYDYEPQTLIDHPYCPDYHHWRSTQHKRMIHHISRSALIWSENAKKDKTIYKEYHDKVLHAILAHHNCSEAGSPVAPKSRVAWLVTLCDNLSARMRDAHTFDIIKGEL
ncbi:MAG: HD domain-containing protein [Thermoplasmatales archaeon]|nr:MAG: HD domain-containing protein [Thermoplasmatales archaeon]